MVPDAVREVFEETGLVAGASEVENATFFMTPSKRRGLHFLFYFFISRVADVLPRINASADPDGETKSVSFYEIEEAVQKIGKESRRKRFVNFLTFCGLDSYLPE